MPGGGGPASGGLVLAQLAEEDLSWAGGSKGHTDALAILAELGVPYLPAGRKPLGGRGPRCRPVPG